MKALRRACLAKGVRLHYQTPVTGFERQNGASPASSAATGTSPPMPP
jgi:hypothetical protein